MEKLKLKSVQTNMAGGRMNLRSEGGYMFDGSGFYDASGNLIEQGWIDIPKGRTTFVAGGIPSYYIAASWESGSANLPINFNGTEPFVNTEFKAEAPIDGSGFSDYIPNVVEHWVSPVTARIDIDDEIGATLFTLPFTYHYPQDYSE